MKRPATFLPSPQTEPTPFVMKFSINLSAEVGKHLKETAYEQRLSESSIVEVGLKQLFDRISPNVLGSYLRQNGACLRRKA